MSIEAMKQALEALDLSNPRFGIGTAKHISATAALRQAIAEAEKQEPVAYIDHADGAVIWKQEKPAWGSVLYTHPQPKVKHSDECIKNKWQICSCGVEPKRKPLTDEMTKQMKERCDSMEMRGAFADGWLSAEAAHNIKE
jgi:hypothetical protein